jgi:hypothetical protein
MPVQVLDTTGRVVLQAKISGGSTIVSVNSLSEGTYVIRTQASAKSLRIIR